jgi:Zn-dependent M28 family amino/carboxypeptidase
MEKSRKENLFKHVEFLTALRPFRNYRNLKSLKKSSDYISNNLKEYGFQVTIQKWEAEGNIYENVIAIYQPEKKEKLIIGAHYDVCGDQAGADDNASAVAGLLETARLISENSPNIDFGIEFVAFCLEEPPFFSTKSMGSYIHARSIFDSGEKVIGMICYEMIGYFSDEPNSQPYPSPELSEIYPSTANFIMVVGVDEFSSFNQKVYKKMIVDSRINVKLIEFPDRHGLAGMSDHSSYWEFGYAALMINDTSFIRNPNYHEETDTIDTLDFDKMNEVINSCYNAIVTLNE